MISNLQIGDEIKAQSLGIVDLPALVYFEDNIPNIYTGDLRVERDVLDWLVEQLKSDEIEEVTDEILDNLIERHPVLIAVFCKTNFIGIDISHIIKRSRNVLRRL